MIRQIKASILRFIYKGAYRNGHYYSPVPDLNDVYKRQKDIFLEKAPEGIDLNIKNQEQLLQELEQFTSAIEYSKYQKVDERYYSENNFFNITDAAFCELLLRYFRPRSVIEVGSGFSSALMMDTNRKYFGNAIDLTFIEPYPERLNSLMSNTERINGILMKEFIQDVDISVFKKLQKNDVLFIDSSHVSKVGSDVNHIIFNILPALNEGVIIHFHDIVYPFEYPKDWIYNGVFWNEAYLLRAFLMHNTDYEILLFNNYIGRYKKEWLRQHLPVAQSAVGGSLWLRKKK